MQHVVITGGSSGIGEAFAGWYLARGDRVTIIGRSAERLQAARQRLTQGREVLDARLLTLSADVRDQLSLVQALGAACSRSGTVTRLIACAGIVKPGPFDILEDADFTQQMAVNYFGTLHAVRAVYPQMKAQGGGRILLVSSGAGLIGLYGYTGYSASKFALVGFAEALRAEAAEHGTSVSICFPPDTDTPQLAVEREVPLPGRDRLARLGGLWSPQAVARKTLPAFERGRFNIYLGLGVWWLGYFGGILRPILNAWAIRRP